MNKKNRLTPEVQPETEPLLFDPAEATPFRADLFNDTPVNDPEIDLLTVKAINRSQNKATISDEAELEIEHAMMILNSHRKELAELETLEEGKISNKKIAVVMIILLCFVTFIVVMFLASKLISNTSSNSNNLTKTDYNNGIITDK